MPLHTRRDDEGYDVIVCSLSVYWTATGPPRPAATALQLTIIGNPREPSLEKMYCLSIYS